MPVKCFVVGCSRSGTTLFSVMLDRNSQLAMTPETGFYAEIAPKMVTGRKDELEHLLGHWPRLPELGLDAKDVMDRCGEISGPADVFDVLLRLYANARRKTYCGEKTPCHWRSIESLLADFPKAHIFFMMRDGRDAILSLASMPWWKHGLDGATKVWLEAAQVAHSMSSRHPERVSIVKYEDLVAAPELILSKAMARMGLVFEPDQLDSRKASNVVMARSMAWKGRALQAIDHKRIGHWRHPDQLEAVDRITDQISEQLAIHGYS